jgi:hypothetical protein
MPKGSGIGIGVNLKSSSPPEGARTTQQRNSTGESEDPMTAPMTIERFKSTKKYQAHYAVPISTTNRLLNGCM